MRESCADVSPNAGNPPLVPPSIHGRQVTGAEHGSRRPRTFRDPVARAGVSRRGALTGELLLVLAGVGCVVVCLKVLVRPPEHPELPQRIDLISGYELSLQDEFVCLVSLAMTGKPDSTELPVYVSRVKFVCDAAEVADVFLLDVTVEENGHLNQRICRTWNLLNTTEALDHLYERGEIDIAPARMTEDEQLVAISHAISHRFRPVTDLQEPLQRQLPRELRETGILVLTNDVPLDQIHQIEGFPQERLAAAIDELSAREKSASGNLMAVLSTNRTADPNLTMSEQHSVSQSLVKRLLEFLLPQESATGHSTETGVDPPLDSLHGELPLAVSPSCSR